MTPLEIAELIRRFMNEKSLYPEEWVKFAETPQQDKKLDAYGKRCNQLDPLVNRSGEMDPEGVAGLR